MSGCGQAIMVAWASGALSGLRGDITAGEANAALAIAMAPKAETEGLRGLSPAKRGAKQSPKVQP